MEDAQLSKSKNEDLMIEAKGFFDFYKKELGESLRKGKNAIFVDFAKLAEYSNKLAEEILANPEENLRILEIAIEESGLITSARVRLSNLSKSHEIKVRNIRSKNINELIVVEGIIRQASDVRPQVVNAKFECPSCGTVLSVLQIEKKFREPSRCSCGRRGGFKLISKEMVDTQRLVIEEAPESLTGGEQPKRMNIFLKEDLVEPLMEEKTTPGSRVKIIGVLKEVPVPLQSGGLSTRFELALEANNVIPLEETFEELNINDEDERQILELSQDPKVFEKLTRSMIPSVWGYDEIKRCLILQLFGGVKKVHADGQKSRGDFHILLIGDPGVAKSATLVFMSGISPKGRYVVGKSASLDYNEPLLIRKEGKQKFVKIGEFVDNYYKNGSSGFLPCDEEIEALSLELDTLKLVWKPLRAIFRHKNKDKLLSFSLETGRKIRVTKDHSIFCIEEGAIKCKPSQELKEGDYVVIPKTIPTNNSELPEDVAKFLGYFIAEGHLYNNYGSYKIQFTLNKNETDIASEINYISEKFLNKEAKISKHGENSIRVTIYGKEPYTKMCSWLGNIAHKRATEKGVPEIIMNSHTNARQSFFDSYILGDAGVTMSERLMSELLYMKLQDKVIASCLERKVNLMAILKDGRKITSKGTRFDILSPKKNKIFMNMRLNFPLNCLHPTLRRFFKRKFKQDYNRINLEKIDNRMLFERISVIHNKQKIFGKDLRKMFGEKSIEYFSKHKDIFHKKKMGREIQISLTEEGKKVCEGLINLKKLLKSDIAFIKIKKIEEINSTNDFVYDVSTPDENFIAGFGGILCHNSGAGLTATVVRDEYLRGWSLEAGAMVLANKGLVCIDELEKMDPNDRSAMHEAMEQQCYHHDTIITLADGSEAKIGELVEKLMEQNKGKVIEGKDCLILPCGELGVLTTDFTDVYKTKAARVSKHKAFDKFIKIKFSHGREITVTPEHPVFIAENGTIITRRADEIKIGDPVPIPLQVPINGKEQYFDINSYNKRAAIHIKTPKRNGPELFKILGYLISEGSKEINRKKIIGINFTNKDKRLLNEFGVLMKSVFGLSPYKQAKIDENGVRWMYRYTSTELADFFKKTSPEALKTAGEKEIPSWAMKGKREDIARMLSSLFEGDGYVSKKERTIRIGYKSKSHRLVEQIQDLLLRFGVRSSITRDREYFRVGVTGYENVESFQDSIKFVTEEKNAIVERYLSEKTIKRQIKDVIPLEFNDRIISIIKEENIEKVGKYKQYGLIYDHEKRKNTFCFSKSFLRNLLPQIKKKGNKDFIRQFTQDIGWEHVSGIEIIENDSENWVYDITIEPNHAFVSQAAILHNTITVSKANVQATLRAETSVLAAANPKFGRFDPYQSIAQQIDLPPTLINRFDVIFPLRDLPNREKDELIATHVLYEHQKIGEEMLIPKDLLRKYVAYAKQRIKPVLTDEAVEEIKKFYVELRNMPISSEGAVRPIPISARQLQALIRMSEASAKMRLSETVDPEDSKRAIEIMKYYLMQVGYDYESKTFDIDRGTGGMAASQRNKVFTVRDTIIQLESRMGKMIPVEEIEKELEGKLTKDEIEEAITKLDISGVVFRPRKGYIGRT